jgi:site-specific recombinase XerD
LAAFSAIPDPCSHAAGYALAARGVDTRTLQAFMGHRSIANTVVYTAVADKRIRNIWGK